MSLVAAYYTTRASLAWAPKHDERKVLMYLEKFYTVAQRYSGLHYNVKRVVPWSCSTMSFTDVYQVKQKKRNYYQ